MKRFSNKLRDVDNLSYPHDDSKTSVNANISSAGITHTTIQAFITAIRRLGRGTMLWKCDVKSAYKQVSVRLHDWHLLGSHMPDGFWFSLVCPF